MNIRQATKADAEEIRRLFYNTVHTVNRRDYSPKQTRAWASPEKDVAPWEARQDSRLVFVAEQNAQIAGFAELEGNGHIDCFYCHKDFQRQGIGTALLNHLVSIAEALEMSRLFADVSITALPFFSHHRFTVVTAQEVMHRGAAFLNYKMERRLTPTLSASKSFTAAPSGDLFPE